MAEKNDAQSTKNDWKLKRSAVLTSSNFVCILMRRDISGLKEDELEEVYRTCELLQTSVVSVDMHTSYLGTFVTIKALNQIDPKTKNNLWTQVRTLIDRDSTAYLELRNLDEQNNEINTEKYILADVEIHIERAYTDVRKPQYVEIKGEVRNELIM